MLHIIIIDKNILVTEENTFVIKITKQRRQRSNTSFKNQLGLNWMFLNSVNSSCSLFIIASWCSSQEYWPLTSGLTDIAVDSLGWINMEERRNVGWNDVTEHSYFYKQNVENRLCSVILVRMGVFYRLVVKLVTRLGFITLTRINLMLITESLNHWNHGCALTVVHINDTW